MSVTADEEPARKDPQPGKSLLPATTSQDDRRLLANWLAVIAALVMAMILIGGATRLTDSGLSITEWQVISGTLPPLSDAAWQDAFEKYKQIPEYHHVNKGMSLDQFKTIFWWEWGHRFLGRLIGLVFFVPMLVFFIRRQIGSDLALPIIGLFVLGGLQGALGWFMVQSGLTERVDVSQYRLAAHLGFAFFLLGALLWMINELRRPKDAVAVSASPLLVWAGPILLALVYLQIILGAFVAGLDAGFIFNTWPLMDGRFVPGSYSHMSPFWTNLFENHATVQFNHRLLAYIVFAVSIGLAAYCWRSVRYEQIQKSSYILAAAVILQMLLGIWTLLAVVPIQLGLAHQAGAVIVFMFAISFCHSIFRNAA